MYKLNIIEQPRNVRTSGYVPSVVGRSIDPVPILQLVYQEANGSVITNGHSRQLLAANRFVTHVRLFSGDGTRDLTEIGFLPGSNTTHSIPQAKDSPDSGLLPSERSAQLDLDSRSDRLDRPSPEVVQRGSNGEIFPLFGNLVSPSHFARGLDQVMGVFFVFGNLSIRTEGTFRLQFVLVDLKLLDPDPQPAVMATVMSDVFESHSWRTFPGMTRITPLTRHLVDQGVVRILRKTNLTTDEAQKPRISARNTSA
ncbi:velvet factor [Polychytrium aggregatum]|uniref:velvet factor n=1 Tax=Polychytrium aggregatum TaxID=110093 RepID=UPI0022FEAAF8|nr:velvet factor [Polychytrium aggregatum]KAI9206923.1 velvet factor [Polychytrium aggregatum]